MLVPVESRVGLAPSPRPSSSYRSPERPPNQSDTLPFQKSSFKIASCSSFSFCSSTVFSPLHSFASGLCISVHFHFSSFRRLHLEWENLSILKSTNPLLTILTNLIDIDRQGFYSRMSTTQPIPRLPHTPVTMSGPPAAVADNNHTNPRPRRRGRGNPGPGTGAVD